MRICCSTLIGVHPRGYHETTPIFCYPSHTGATMALKEAKWSIHVIRIPTDREALNTFASIFRDLRLQALRDDPDAFTERHDDVAKRSAEYWTDFLRHHTGLVHIAFGIPPAKDADVTDAETNMPDKLIMADGKPLGTAVNSGPLPQDRFPSLPGSNVPLCRPDNQEQRFHGGMLFHVPSMRGGLRGLLFEHLVLDRDEWLLEQLQSAGSDPPPVARFRGNVKPGSRQKSLLDFYIKAGWYIAGTQTRSANLLAEGGKAAVEAGIVRGDAMEEESIVVEKIFTVPLLQWQIKKNRRLLDRHAAARL